MGKVEFKIYPKYKNSGIEWLKRIPDAWEVKRLKYILTEVNIRSETGTEELLSLSKYKGVIAKSNLEEKSGQAQTLTGYKKVFPNCLVINKMQAVNGILAVSKIQGITSPDYSIYKAINPLINIDFYGYLLTQPEYLAEYKKVVTGVMEGYIRLYTENLFHIRAFTPPLCDQESIVAFIQAKSIQIDKLILLKENQIKLLKERREIVINNALSNGVSVNNLKKESKAAWIGEIPATWQFTAIKRLLSIPITDGPHSTPELLNEGIPFISAEAIKNGDIDFEKKRGYISRKNFLLFSKKYIPRKGDIYMVKSGATTGNVAMVKTDIEFTIWSPLAVFRANEKLIKPEYLYYFLQSESFKKGVELNWSFGTQQNIGMGVLGNLPVAYPGLLEQSEIVKHIESSIFKIMIAVNCKLNEIEKLKEYKSILINNAVTGKIKVT